ncbi:phosphotransferase family protein [Gorillibacterium sp. sgz500922]|uniref:phosphotransferase family protein n=1 Tax=Gorillibacterium sp. sgz500922 TaxID=3446694 RepID=UPI003F6611F0
MESATKQRLSEAAIRKLAEQAFPGERLLAASELTEGYFNTAYRLHYQSGREVIMKVAPNRDMPVMTHEKAIMRAEAECMRLVREQTNVPVVEVLAYDDSHVHCESDCLFMSCMEGRSYNALRDSLSEEERDRVEFELGGYNARLNEITNDRFGYFGQPDKQGAEWYPVFASMLEDCFADAKRLSIELGVSSDAVRKLLARDSSWFAEVRPPRLVHWDLWAGNVFVEDGHVVGLIDFERCLWADELMEVGFRSFNRHPQYLAGYGASELTNSQQRRILWYDLYLHFIAALETDYRQYPDRGLYDMATRSINKTMERLRQADSTGA